MTQASNERAALFYAETYDDSMSDWPGEIDFYREAAARARQAGGPILELGCGTGRVAIRIARDGGFVVGLDLSPHMLEVARRKSISMDNVRWVEGNMRSFELGESFALVLIPGHAFQHLNTVDDQLGCLTCALRHLTPDGHLVVHVDHQDMTWLAGLLTQKTVEFEPRGHFTRSANGRDIRAYRAWSYEPSTQTALSQARWEEVDAEGAVVETWQTPRVPLHCVFRFEMEHLLARAGFEVEALYGDFYRHPLADNSTGMIWVARSAQGLK